MAVCAGHVQCAVAAAFVDGGEEDGVGRGVDARCGGFERGSEGGEVAEAGGVEDVVELGVGEEGWGFGWHCVG